MRGAASLLLLNEVWFVSITSFSNVPYWSICYEMWYYVAFGLVMFLPRRIGLAGYRLTGVSVGAESDSCLPQFGGWGCSLPLEATNGISEATDGHSCWAHDRYCTTAQVI